MDPLSIIASTAGISDVTFRLVRFLKGTIQGARDVDEDLRKLLVEVESLISINNGISSITAARDFEHLLRRSFEDSDSLTESWKQLWHDTSRIANDITRILEKLEAILKDVQGADCNVQGIRADETDEQCSQCQPVRHRNLPFPRISCSSNTHPNTEKVKAWNLPKLPKHYICQDREYTDSSTEAVQICRVAGCPSAARQQPKCLGHMPHNDQSVSDDLNLRECRSKWPEGGTSDHTESIASSWMHLEKSSINSRQYCKGKW